MGGRLRAMDALKGKEAKGWGLWGESPQGFLPICFQTCVWDRRTELSGVALISPCLPSRPSINACRKTQPRGWPAWPGGMSQHPPEPSGRQF